MSKIFKYPAMLLISVLTLSLGACTDEYEYSGATAEGEQVYFSNTLPQTIDLNKNENKVEIPVNRIQKEGGLTVDLDVTVSEGSKITVPSTVTFADGQSVANLVISYDPSQIELGHYDNVTLSIKDRSYTTPYGNSSYSFSAGLSEWKSMGKGIYREGILSTFYGTDVLTYEVEIQENVNTPGIYRVVTPYGEGSDFYKNYIATGEFAWTGESNTSMVIDATDPDYVYITGDFYPGTDDGMASRGYGVMHLFSIVDQEAAQYGLDAVKENEPELFGKLQDGVITFPEIGIYVNFDESLTALGYLNTSNLAIALPGNAFVDYSSSFTYTGRFIDLNDKYYAQGKITLGENVASAKYVLAVEGDDTNAIIEGLNDGSVTPIATITENTDVSLPLEESGNYVMIIVTYDAESNMKGSSATTFKFSVNTLKPDWQPVFNGTFTHDYMPNFVGDGHGNAVGNPLIQHIEPSYPTVLYQDVNNPSSYKIEPWIEGSLPFTMNSDGAITFSKVETGFTYGQYGPVYASDANSLLKFNEPTSFIDEELGFVFGTVYHLDIEDGYLGGAFEIFTPTSYANAPTKGKRRELKSLFPVKSHKKGLMLMADKAKQINPKGNLKK